MTDQNITLQFQYAMMTVILFSITNYIFISYKNIGKKVQHINLLVQKIINVSLLSIIYSTFLVMKGLFFNNIFGEKSLNFNFIFYSIMILCLFLAIVVLIIWNQYKSKKIQKFSTLFPILVSIIAIITPFKYFYSCYYISVILFLGVLSLFFYKFFFHMKMKFNPGVYYIFGGSITLVVSTLYSVMLKNESANFFNFFNIGLMVFIMLGVFLFFVTYFIYEIEDGFKKLLLRDCIIEDKDKEIEFRAFHDGITGIQNQTAFERDIREEKNSVYLCLFNIHNFKAYNNLLGFNRGNQLLNEVANIISESVPENVTVYRFYSDKFLVKFSDHSRKRTYEILNSIINIFKTKTFQGINLDAYFGLLLFSNESFYPKTDKISFIINSLEISSSLAKEEGKDIHEYSFSDNSRFTKQTNIELQLKKAIASNDFMIYYQPQVNKVDKKICSFESLIRWKCNGEFISPSQFIPIAESKGLMDKITKYVINQVFNDITSEKLFAGKRVSINLSTDQLVNESFIDFIENICKSYPIDPKNIVFEITETSLFNDLDKINQTINKLKAFGFQISLDDFGIGYSSIFRFAKLDIDEIKFDKAFLSDISNDKIYNTIKKTSELFKSFNMRIIFEGVETKQQMESIDNLPIDSIQGFLFFKPMALEDLKKII